MKQKVLKILEKSHTDAIIVSSGPNLRYLIGLSVETFERPFLLLSSMDKSVLLAPEMERERLSKAPVDDFLFYTDEKNPYQILGEYIQKEMDEKIKVVGVDSHIKFWLYYNVRKLLPNKEFIDIGGVFLESRLKKNREEIKRIEKAVKIIEDIYKKLENILSTGMTEIEVSYEIMKIGESLGSDHIVFAAVQSGPNSAIPHHERSLRKIEKNDVIVIDIALSYDGYYGDLTRVFVLGKSPSDFKEKYSIIRRAVEKAVDTVKPGYPAKNIDSVAREYLTEYGLERYFIHRTGHGLGLEVHERPYIAPQSTDVLEEGMVFTIEPGVYFTGRYGLRLETDVVVSEDDVRVLDKYSWEPIYL